MCLFSCNEWLEVNPRTEKRIDRMFDSQEGFQDALTGAYLELIHDHSYGEYLTKSKIENLVNFWTTAANSGEKALSIHNYEHSKAKTLIEQIYARQYKAILAVNAILERVDDSKGILSLGGYQCIKGESLAIRAMCHFDLLRLFGPIPGREDDSPVLSYMTTVNTKFHPLDDYEILKTAILNDFLQAEQLLSEKHEMIDEIAINYYRNHKTRIDKYAVKALLARAYLWFGNTKKANQYAMEIIAAVEAADLDCRIGEDADMAEFDYMLTPEHIFALSRTDAYSKYVSIFQGFALYKGSNEALIKNDLYGSSGTDIRELNLWEQLSARNQAQYYVTKKYFAHEKPGREDRKLEFIPIIRLSEIYFIAIETGGANPENQALWDAFTTARNVENVALPSNLLELQNLLLKEYRKEFYGEGLAFYLYKRLNLPKEQFLWPQESLNVNYVLPLPVTEIQ